MLLEAQKSLQPSQPNPVPEAVRDSLAARFRAAGMALVQLRTDGTIEQHDREAGAFFDHYVVPQLRTSTAKLAEKIVELSPKSPTAVWTVFPSVAIAAVGVVEKRKISAVLLLAAKDSSFGANEDVLRLCSQLSLDATWLNQQADQLPAFGAAAIAAQGNLLFSMLQDQLSLYASQHQLNELSEELASTYEELSLIYQISGGTKINDRPLEFFKRVCLDASEVMNVRGMGILFMSKDGGQHEPMLYGECKLPLAQLQDLGRELMPAVIARQGMLLVNDLAGDETLPWLAPHARQLIAVPLQRQDQMLGCLFALDKRDGEFNSVDGKLLMSIGNQAAIFLENSVLFEDLHGLMMGLLHSLTSAVDAKDPYTCGHSERVALLSQNLSRVAGLSEKEIEEIYMAGLLHDVGKIGVPEAVLQKTGRLTPEEFEQMKKHPAIGARILQDVKEVRHIVPGVLHHHERYDGKGYPARLAGEDIPLMGRIICLADCFDAMTSNRTYRKALPLELALIEIRRCAGTQFDPLLADAFLRTSAAQYREILGEYERSARTLRPPQVA